MKKVSKEWQEATRETERLMEQCRLAKALGEQAAWLVVPEGAEVMFSRSRHRPRKGPWSRKERDKLFVKYEPISQEDEKLLASYLQSART